SRIYEYSNSLVRIFSQGDDLESPNGLLVKDGKLFVAAWGLTSDFSNPTKGRLYSLDLTSKQKAPVTAEPLGNLDGLQWDGSAFLVSDWTAGKVFRVSPDGKVRELLQGMKGAADLGWLSGLGLLVLPRMGENRLSAF